MQPSAASEAPLYALCYDIGCARERRRVDKLLKGYGNRSQKSVFECNLTPSQRQALLAALHEMALRTGHVRIYRVYSESQVLIAGNKADAAVQKVFTYGI